MLKSYITKGVLMKNLSLSIVVAIFLHGCLYNNMDSLNNFYQKDIKSKKQLIKTQKAILYDGNKTKAILVATYSNDFDDINSSDERFVVSFYADDKFRWIYFKAK